MALPPAALDISSSPAFARLKTAAPFAVDSLPQNEAQFAAYNFSPLDQLCLAITAVVRELHPRFSEYNQEYVLLLLLLLSFRICEL